MFILDIGRKGCDPGRTLPVRLTWPGEIDVIFLLAMEERKRHEKGGADAFLRGKPDPSSLALHQFSTEVETQPRSADAPGLGIVGTDEAAKHLPLLMAGNANTAI